MELDDREITDVEDIKLVEQTPEIKPFDVDTAIEIKGERTSLLKTGQKNDWLDQLKQGSFKSFKNAENIAGLELFKQRGFISNEPWTNTINYQAQVIQNEGDLISCACLIDKEKHYFETRQFPKYLFGHIKRLSDRPFVFITIRTKLGSSRIDIVNGETLVNRKYFETKEKIERLMNMGDLNEPLEGPIKA